jgi:anti-anti-sigma regulatory factor
VKKKSRTGKSKAIELPPRLSIAQSADVQRMLVSGLDTPEPLILDGSGVEEIDTAILQLLVSAWLGNAKRGVECRWEGASEPLRHAALLIGVAATLQFDGATGAAG